MVLAHYDKETGKKQTLLSHLVNVAVESKKQGERINQGSIMFLVGLFHDLGKADSNFQTMMIEQNREKVNHSYSGAKYIFNYAEEHFDIFDCQNREDVVTLNSFLNVVCYVITAHHGYYDLLNVENQKDYMGERNHLQRFLNFDTHSQKKYHYEDEVIPYAQELVKKVELEYQISFPDLLVDSFKEFESALNQLEMKDQSEKDYYLSLFVRLYLSILKNADIKDTINAYDHVIEPFSKEIIQQKKRGYLESVETLYESFQKPTTAINKVRTDIADKALERGKFDSPGVYRLDLPTGAGKTLVSLRYGVHQLNRKNKDQFIYITPFLSVLEQNASEIKEILNDDDIIEHHSNMVKEKSEIEAKGDEDDKNNVFQNYLTDTWDSPVVLSTMVQFFNTLFKEKSANIRRFSSLINSVVVLDEVQSLPIEVTTLFNLTINFLSCIMQSNIILCTATQPNYNSDYVDHRLNYGGLNKEEADLVKLNSNEQSLFERTEVYKLNDESDYDTLDDITEEVLEHGEESCLVILNTKKAVNDLYDLISSQTDRQVYYLTTNLCPKHRQNIIAEVRKDLREDQPIICVSSQLIEAGVDVDFNRLIRSYAGIDSIIQSMGRCNREGKQANKGIVKLAKLPHSVENLSQLREIKTKKETTQGILDKIQSPIPIVEFNDEFYDRYYANNQHLLDYPIKKDHPNAYQLLSSNQPLKKQKRGVKGDLNQSFLTAAREVNLIDEDNQGVIVYYGDNHTIINHLIERIDAYERSGKNDFRILKEVKGLLNQLQPYTVNLYSITHYRHLVMSYLEDSIYILPEPYYKEDKGIVKEAIIPLF